jgi:Flp pilus assembly protein TadD
MMRVADETRAHGDLGTAVTLYRRVHEINPTDPRPLGSLAATLTDLHAYTEAAETYRVAIGINPNPNQGELYRGLAVVLLLLNQPDAALDTLQQALAKAPQDGRIYSAMGVTHDLMGRHDLAQQDYQSGMRLMPKSTGLRNNYGLSLALAGDYPAAVATLTELTLDANSSPRHRLNLALVYGLAGDDKKAAAIARTALDEKAVASNLAYYAMLRGMDDKARANAIMGGQLMGQVAVAEHPGLRGGAEDVAKVEPAPREPVSTAALDSPAAKPMTAKEAAQPAASKAAEAAPEAPMLAEAPMDVVGGDLPADAAPNESAAVSPAPAPSEPTKLAKGDTTPAADAPASAQAATDQPATPPASDQAAVDQPQTPPASEPAPATSSHKRVASAPTTSFSVQVGTFASEGNAKKLADQLNQKGYSLAVVHYRDSAGREWFAVRAGGYGSADEAAAAARHMHDAEQVPAVVVHQRGSTQA